MNVYWYLGSKNQYQKPISDRLLTAGPCDISSNGRPALEEMTRAADEGDAAGTVVEHSVVESLAGSELGIPHHAR